MKIDRLLKVAARAISRNKMRSFLTMLGVIIGVASVVALVALGAGAQVDIERQIASMGTNLLMVMPGISHSGGVRGGSGSLRTLTLADIERLRKDASNLSAVSAVTGGHEQVIAGGRNWNTMVSGVDPEYFLIRDWKTASGRTFNKQEVRTRAKVAVLGRTTARELFPDQDPVGARIRVRNVPFTVIGVLTAKGQSAMGSDEDDTVLAPSTTVLYRLQDRENISRIMASATDARVIEAASGEVELILRDQHRLAKDAENDFRIMNQADLITRATAVTGTLTLLLSVVAGVSLLVGGIGIMNIMLVSVTERTREIGVRMALGARSVDILMQFLVEAVVLSAAGGVLGLSVGLGGAYAMGAMMGVSVVPDPSFMVVAFLFSTLVGVFFGFYPARKAALLNPIDALRYE